VSRDPVLDHGVDVEERRGCEISERQHHRADELRDKGMEAIAANCLTSSGRKQNGLETVLEQLGDARRSKSGSMLNESETLEEM
jgi:hypothetical protein